MSGGAPAHVDVDDGACDGADDGAGVGVGVGAGDGAGEHYPYEGDTANDTEKCE